MTMNLKEALINSNNYDSEWGIWAERNQEGKFTLDSSACYGQMIFESGKLVNSLEGKEFVGTCEFFHNFHLKWLGGDKDNGNWEDNFVVDNLLKILNVGLKDITILQVDWENNSEDFWDWFHRRFPYAEFESFFIAPPKVIDEITSAPGWEDPEAPKYAPNPLIVIEPDNDEEMVEYLRKAIILH